LDLPEYQTEVAISRYKLYLDYSGLFSFIVN
jgi:hypothetical protein